MRGTFLFCKSLKYLPDISKWDTRNVQDFGEMFHECSSLKKLPDISKWNTKNVRYKEIMFLGCDEAIIIPKKFK